MGIEKWKGYFGGKAVIDASLKIQKADDELYGFTGDNAIYSLARSIHPEDLSNLEKAISKLDKTKTAFITLRALRYDGEYRWMVVILSYLGAELEDEKLISLKMEDITNIQSELDEGSKRDEIYEEYLSLVDHLMIAYEPNNDRLRVFMIDNQQKLNFYNGSLKLWKNRKLQNGDIDKKDIPVFNILCESLSDGDKQFSYEIKIKIFQEDNTPDWCLFKGKTITYDSGEKYVVAVVSKINPMTKKSKMNFMSENGRDAGTDLLNKRAITKYAMDLIASKPDYNVTFVVIDLDNFKYINDTYGHMFGDDVLCKVAEILKEAVENRGVVGRIGGDEFFIVLENVNYENELRSILRTIRMNVEWAYKHKLKSLKLSCSMGSAKYPADAEDYQSLFNIADKCLYIAKEKGKNRYIIFSKEIHNGYIKGADNIILSEKDFSKYNKIAIVNEIIERFLTNKELTIEEACEKVGLCFGLDDISVYSAPDWKRKSYWSDLTENEFEGAYFGKDNYPKNFNDNNVLVVDSINLLEFVAPSAFESLDKAGITTSIQYMAGIESNPKGFITFNKTKQAKKWTELDITYLSLLGKILEMVVL